MKYEHKWRKPRYIYGTGFFEYRRKKRSLEDYRTTLNGKFLIRTFIRIIYFIISYYLFFFSDFLADREKIVKKINV